MSERGVSDLVGFTLMFSIIIMSVAVVSTAGITQLSELSEREGLNSAERGVEAFAGSADDLSRHGDLVRRATLSPSGGLVWFNDSEIAVRVEGEFSQTYDVNALEHQFSRNPEDVAITYEAGGVMRSDGGGAIVRPQWHCSSDRAVVTLVRLTPGDNVSHGSGFGSGTGDIQPTSGDEVIRGDIESTDSGVTFQLARTGTEVRTYDGGGLDLGINPAGSANAEQWGFFFERRGGTWSEDGSYYECENVDVAVVRVVTVELSALDD